MRSVAVSSVVLSLMLVLGACNAKKPGGGAGQSQAALDSAPTTKDCNQASLLLPAETVIANVGSNTITIGDLGPNYTTQESQLQREYCQKVYSIREKATTNKISLMLIDDAAKKAGQEPKDFVKAYMDKNAAKPSDKQVTDFYNQYKGPSTPPLAKVKAQVEMTLLNQERQKAMATLLASLRKDAAVKVTLPDVRPPALTISTPDYAPSQGPQEAKVKIVEFSDFQCPYCSMAAKAMDGVKKRFGDQVQVIYRNYPLPFHANARDAAIYGLCANQQQKFWPMHDKMFANQSKLDKKSLRSYASALGLDMKAFDKCSQSTDVGKQVDADMQEGEKLGVAATPTLFINGRKYAGGLDEQDLDNAIQAALQK